MQNRVSFCLCVMRAEVCCLFLFAISLLILNARSESVGPSLSLTDKETTALQQFKKMILPKVPPSSVLFNISKDDLYLMTWLRSTKLNVKDAEHSFLQNLKWREHEKIDGILNEDWKAFELDYPAFDDTFDKFSRPTSEIWISDWNVRRAALTGQLQRLSRWLYLRCELNMRRLYKLRREGKNVTQTVLLADMEGFNFRHGCALCNQIYFRWGFIWENYYPDTLKNVVVINMTPSFQAVLDGMKPFLRPETKTAVKTYALKRHWLPALDKQFDKSERSVRFGGNKKRIIAND